MNVKSLGSVIPDSIGFGRNVLLNRVQSVFLDGGATDPLKQDMSPL